VAVSYEEGTERDLAGLRVARVGALVETGDPWEPLRLADPLGVVVVPVAEYLKDLQAAGKAVATQRSYGSANAVLSGAERLARNGRAWRR
jgi:hypothetical protein